MTDIIDTLKAAVAGKDGTDPVELSAEDVYEIIGELAYLRRQTAQVAQMGEPDGYLPGENGVKIPYWVNQSKDT